MKIRFLEPKAPNLHIFSAIKLPRLGSILLATIAKKKGHDTKVYVEEIAPIDWNDIMSADLVCISSITSTAPRAYALADKIRQMNIPVVLGGPHPTYLPEEAALHSDFVLKGEGETSFFLLLDALQNQTSCQDVPGITFQRNDVFFHSDKMPVPTDLSTLPHPDFSLIHDFEKARGFWSKRILPVQVSRGCPFDCSFCSVTGMFGRKMRYRPIENVMSELLQYNEKKTHIFFYDDNFAASPERAKELLRAMKEAKTTFRWSTQVRIDASRDEELLSLMRDTHCDLIYIGLESINPQSLADSNKEQTVEQIQAALKKFKKYGIDVHGMFVMGFDSDTPQTASEIASFAKLMGLMSIQAMILTPLPGTEVYRSFEQQKRLLFTDWSLFDSHHVVFKHPHLSAAELQKMQLTAHRQFYSYGRMLKLFLKGEWTTIFIALYARRLQRTWKKQNSLYLKILRLLKHSRELEIKVDIRKRCIVE